MIGAIAGDVIGSVHEGTRTRTKAFPLFVPASRFTDDTVLTVAVADCLRTLAALDERLRGVVKEFAERFGAGPGTAPERGDG